MIGLYILFVGVLYVLVALSTSYWLSRFPERQKTKTWTQILTVLVFVLIPTWDIVPGKLYFKYLCNTEGGIRVYRQVGLPAKYWREDSLPRTTAAEIKGFRTRIGENYYLKVLEQNDYVPLFNIDRQEDSLINIESNELVAKMTHFRYWGGWLITNTGLSQSAASCPGKGAYVNFYKRVFVKGK